MRHSRRVAVCLLVLTVGLGITQLRAHDPSQFTYTIIAGTAVPVAPGFVDGPGLTAARFNAPRGIAGAAGGEAIVADTANHAIRRISAAQVVTTIAGTGSSGSQDGPIASASFSGPLGVAVHSDGTIYVADTGNHTVRRISTSGEVTTIAGTAGVSGQVDATGAAASFINPSAIAVDSDHTVFVTSALKIRAITSSGVVTTLAGSGSSGSTDGQGAAASFGGPRGLALTPQNDLVVADYDRVRRVSLAGAVATVTSALGSPLRSIAVRATGEILVSLGDERLVSVSSAGAISVVASGPRMEGLAAGPDGSVFGAPATSTDQSGFIVRRASDSPHFMAWAGQAPSNYELDGQGRGARFSFPTAIARDAAGNLYVADLAGLRIRKISTSGFVTTLAPGVQWRRPDAVAVDSSGYVYVAESDAHMIRRIAPDGAVSEWAGTIGGGNGYVNGPGVQARFRSPGGLAIGGDGALYVADRNNCAIRRIDADRIVTTFAGGLQEGGAAGQCANVDGTGTDARLGYMENIATGPSGDLFVADSSNHTIRRVTMAGVVTTVAGTPGEAGHTDGSRTAARFRYPNGVAPASDGAIYVTDSGSNTVRQIAPDGSVTTIGGVALQFGSAEGTGSAARFWNPRSIIVDPQFNLFITDSNNNTIVKGTPDGLSAPVFTTAPANASVPAGGTANFTVAASGVPAPTFTWEVSTNGGTSYSALADGNGVSGATTATLTWTGVPLSANGYRIRAIATNVMGTATSAHALLMVTGASASPSSLRFGIRRRSQNDSTGPQTVIASYSGPGTPSWTASATVPWLQISTDSMSSQTGAFAIGLNPGGLGLETAPAEMSGTLTIAALSLGVSVTVPVTVRIHENGSLAVIGQVDTPVQDATVQGAIGVTGWTLHPIGVRWLAVYRDCIVGVELCSGEHPVLSNRPVVYVGGNSPGSPGGNIFVPGARPDVEAAFPDYPRAHIGGWGLQILTNMLPRTTGPYAPHGGQGPITLYVIASSFDGTEQALLGRVWTDVNPEPTRVTLDNDAIAKPFGTIDTPGLASTVSGTVANFGWALTPDSDTVVDSTDILIPTDGSSMVVFIDGVATAQVAYNQCRDGVGNPVPAGAFCGDDISNIFGNPTPQAGLDTRTSNPTRYRNLDAARGAIGAHNIDTTLLTNGLHTIAWSVTDSAGRVEGIGSRYFTVLNGSSDAVSAEFGVLSAQRAESRRSLAPRHGSGQPEPLSKVGEGGVRGRTGFDLRRPWTPLHADNNGIRHVRIPIDNGRVELSLGAGIEAGYLEANGERRLLPPGSAFDAATGIFTWAPGPGYLGTYRLVFGGPEVLKSWGPGVLGAPSADSSQVTVDVTLRAETKAAAGESEVRMHLDAARLRQPSTTAQVAPSSVEGQGSGGATTLIDVVGWALDPQAEIGSGIGAVHIWARRVGPGVLGSWGPEVQGGAAPIFLGAAELDVARPDVAAAHGAPFGHAGFRIESAATLAPGAYEITAYVWNWRTARWEDARSVMVTVR